MAPLPADSALKVPPSKRITTPAGERLSAILESNDKNTPPAIPPRSKLRLSGISQSSGRTGGNGGNSRPWMLFSASRSSADTAPPAYSRRQHSWISEGEEEPISDAEREKLAELRLGKNTRSGRGRGGWGKLIAIIVLVLVVVIALGVGLGVGLKKKHQDNNSAQSVVAGGPGNGSGSSSNDKPFPLGEYSFITALRVTATNCTSNSSTWRCYPYNVYTPSDPTTAGTSLTTLNWVITNTSSIYPTNTSMPPGAYGLPSNLTISSTGNPFSMSFSDIPLTYWNDASNSSSPRLSFNFQQSKSVIPSTSLTSNNAAAECFFNSTMFSGTMYLNAPRNYPSAELADSTGVGGYTPWPNAVDVQQSSPGGTDVPACYELVNGVAGSRMQNVLTPQAEADECVCEYRNYG